MKILNHLKANNIFLNLLLRDKNEAIRFAVDNFVKDEAVKDADNLYRGMIERENTMSTGIGGGIGLPHTTSVEAEDAAVIMIRLAEPIEFGSIDDRRVDIVLALVIPENRTSLHLQLLAGVSRLCKNSEFLDAVRKESNSEILWQKISELEEKMAFH